MAAVTGLLLVVGTIRGYAQDLPRRQAVIDRLKLLHDATWQMSVSYRLVRQVPHPAHRTVAWKKSSSRTYWFARRGRLALLEVRGDGLGSTLKKVTDGNSSAIIDLRRKTAVIMDGDYFWQLATYWDNLPTESLLYHGIWTPVEALRGDPSRLSFSWHNEDKGVLLLLECPRVPNGSRIKLWLDPQRGLATAKREVYRERGADYQPALEECLEVSEYAVLTAPHGATVHFPARWVREWFLTESDALGAPYLQDEVVVEKVDLSPQFGEKLFRIDLTGAHLVYEAGLGWRGRERRFVKVPANARISDIDVPGDGRPVGVATAVAIAIVCLLLTLAIWIYHRRVKS